MVALDWCFKRKKGIEFIEPNENLSKDYLNAAEESLKILGKIKGESNIWLATTKYYCEYQSVYSVLMKIGIKCEIHDCVIELAGFLEKQEVLKKGTKELLEKDKGLRIDNQYYLKNKKVDFSYDELLEFILNIKNTLNSLTTEKINKIRNELKKEVDY